MSFVVGSQVVASLPDGSLRFLNAAAGCLVMDPAGRDDLSGERSPHRDYIHTYIVNVRQTQGRGTPAGMSAPARARSQGSE
ncbi:hypothetical protein AA0521_1006 [Komagataeibacter intermedius NRIC 0521]|uniref:Uncharacterized protein n=1 Tax=Komagataeibacter intermedius NRIC 0521 TaxID=1307934 RepID=A0ABQ0PGH6_9PROT|nr:hypothetical protein AA0521_1006 [Komagataeibacter intermedius NRIC 0521]